MRTKTPRAPARAGLRGRALWSLESDSREAVSQHLGVYGIRPARESEGEWRPWLLDRRNSVVGLPPGVSDREAMLLLDALARLKEHRFGRLTVMVSDGRVVDVEVSEKVDHDLLRRLSM